MNGNHDDKIADSTASAPCTGWMQIRDILEEEANQLALVLDNGRTDAALKDAGFTHRVEIAVRREMNRLRELAALAESASNDRDETR